VSLILPKFHNHIFYINFGKGNQTQSHAIVLYSKPNWTN